MLALSRNVGEKIILSTSDGEVEICLIQVNSMTQASIGIRAPRMIQIAREELVRHVDSTTTSPGRGAGK